MTKTQSINALYFSILAVVAVGCSNSSSEPNVSEVDLRFSDAAVDDATEVVITVDRIIFRPGGSADDIVVEQFNGEPIPIDSEVNVEPTMEGTEQTKEAGETDSNVGTDTYTIDLLAVQGADSRLVLDDVLLPVGEYTNMLIEVIDDGTEHSYVTDPTGVKPLKVPSKTLKLGAFTITPTSKQSMVVEFGLQQSMTYNPGPDRYILKPRGVRIVAVDEASMISGTIDHSALHALEQCEALDAGGTSGTLYLYEGHALDVTKLADNFDAAVLTDAAGMISPIASTSLQETEYTLSYIEPGNYTLALGCHTASDDADILDNLTVPNPTAQLVELSLNAGNSLSCSIPLAADTCQPEQN